MAGRYLITGCAGFLGSRVCELLLEAGDEVLGVDDLNDSYDRRLKQHRLERLEARPGFRFFLLDVAQRDAMAVLLDAAPCAAAVHLAARVGVRDSVADPWIYQRANVWGTLNVLDLCRRAGIGKLVLGSTSSVYGGRNPLPYREDADTGHPLSPYAASKKAAELLAHSYHHLYGLDVTVLRYFTVYGPAGRPDMSVLRFVRRICEGEPITVFGDGTQGRDFTFVDDTARGTVAALRPLGYEAVNLGGAQPTSLASLIERIARLAGREALIRHRPAPRADMAHTCADIGKAARLLDWRPEVPLDEGLRRTLAWYRQNRDFALTLRYGD